VLVNSCFGTPKNFSENYQQFWARNLKNVCQPPPKLKKFKERHFNKETQNYYLARGHPHVCGQS
jgi:hypothetical protein